MSPVLNLTGLLLLLTSVSLSTFGLTFKYAICIKSQGAVVLTSDSDDVSVWVHSQMSCVYQMSRGSGANVRQWSHQCLGSLSSVSSVLNFKGCSANVRQWSHQCLDSFSSVLPVLNIKGYDANVRQWSRQCLDSFSRVSSVLNLKGCGANVNDNVIV